jgi:hypothetical protein
MIAHTHEIEYKYGDTIKLIPFFDTHIGALACDVKALKRDIAKAAAEPKALFLLGGDMVDSIIANDKRYQASSVAGSSVDDIVDYEVDHAVDLFSPLRGRIIGALTGNHEWTVTQRCGTNPAKRIARRLDTPYLGFCSMVRLYAYAIHNNKRCRGRSIDIWAHHGHGSGGRTRGGSLTKYDKVRKDIEASIFLFGHDHKLLTDMPTILYHAGDKVGEKNQVLALCGTYLRTFSDDTNPTYSERAGYPPTRIGHPTIEITPNSEAYSMRVSA